MDMTTGQTDPRAGTTLTEDPPTSTNFASLVSSVLTGRGISDSDRDEITDSLTTSHNAGMSYMQGEVEESKNAVAAYVAMERSNQAVMQFTKRTIGTALEINARQHAYAEGLAELRDEMRRLIATSGPSVSTALLQAWSEKELAVPSPAPPVIVGMAVDHRWSMGVFRNTSTGANTQLPFVGWSLVIHHPKIRSGLEPTFMGPGAQPMTTLALSLDGLDLLQLY